jgi:hypothetical protein
MKKKLPKTAITKTTFQINFEAGSCMGPFRSMASVLEMLGRPEFKKRKVKSIWECDDYGLITTFEPSAKRVGKFVKVKNGRFMRDFIQTYKG